MYDVIIIGGGPAGLTAGIYATRRSLKTLILTTDIGGQASKAYDIENYPGLPTVSGVELSKKMFNQAKYFGAEIKFEEAKEIEQSKDSFRVKTNTNDYETKTVIVASGKKPRELNVPGEVEFKGKGVSYCATCDAPFFKNKTVAVIGGGNSALDAAHLCAKISKIVYLIYRGSTFSAEQVLQNQVKNKSNIEILMNSEVAKIDGENKVTSITLKDGKELETDGIIIEIGYDVERKLVENILKLNEKGQVIIDHNQATSVPGIFAAGDLTTTTYKQIVIAAGEGAKAALSAFDYIQRKEGKKGISADWHKTKK